MNSADKEPKNDDLEQQTLEESESNSPSNHNFPYCSNSRRENLIDSSILGVGIGLGIGYFAYNNTHKIWELTNQAQEIASNIAQYVSFISS